jgi:adenylate cyclase
MSEPRFARRLSAILAADIVGFTRMMGADEAGTITRVKALWSDLFHPEVAAHRGRVVKMMGDGALVEFASAVDAVGCALAMQRGMTRREPHSDAPLRLRIGVNLGDIVIDGDDILGEGVNIAARLEAHAPEGGILMSEIVHSQVKGKVAASFDDAGEFQLRNLDHPVRAWQWGGPRGRSASRPSTAAPSQRTARLLSQDIPSLAVLPFATMSQDPEQDFFADGLVDDILTTLSKLSGLSVIARQSSFAYKGKALDVRKIASELGVRHVLQGGVRKAGRRVRITTQLVDGQSGAQVWAERYDRNIEDIFALQDEITLRVATEMQVHLMDGDQARLRYTTTSNVEAWNHWIEGLAHHHGPLTGAEQLKALRCWERALALDPDSGPLNAMVAYQHLLDVRYGWWEPRQMAVEGTQRYLDRARAIDPEMPDLLRTNIGLHIFCERFDEALRAARHAVRTYPNVGDLLVGSGFALQCCGLHEETVPLIERAIAINPRHPAFYLGLLGTAYRLAGRSADAMAAFREYHARVPGLPLPDIIMLQEQTGALKDARRAAAELMTLRPEFTIASWRSTQHRTDHEQLDRDLASLRAAGLPD